ncbi:DNA helicase PcrA [Companilactobacillus ginsenosidimutans]|uniref:ATP-dependent DNA helicase n=1 Tax=Companilactobacillus ginsenosidimutans TaxID=1007676 RepID=A0A0H4QJH6_9LACO|nr:DNA helicase PcrA [Companilactobacillus ginsenosidimutans]AKP68087.1 ATP-dependent DNA helicase PcrA [Companilactobacillus ginsenosidimutans]
MSEESLLKGLNPEQQEAVKATEGPLLIMAGAGSGKTRVLTHRVAYLIKEKNIMPWHILAITFTNKAAKEMKERIGNLLQEDGADVWVSTFHSLCVRILRSDIDKIGYSKSFTIADPAETRTLMKQIVVRMNLDPKRYDPKAILGEISNAKNDLIGPREYAKTAKSPFEQTVAMAYDHYDKEMERNQSMDFDDLIMKTNILFDKNPDVLEKYQDKFTYIHVDEYQDTNEAQYKLVKHLGAKYRNVCVVGDADQSIYGWRGANIKNIMDFEDDYPEATSIKLEQNYRSTQTILNAANKVINHNGNRKPKELWTDNKKGEDIDLYRAQNESDEALFVIEQIKNLLLKGFNYGDYAILYRTNAQSRVFEEKLMQSNIPYKIVGGHKFYDRKEIKDILAYLRLIANPDDSMSFQRVINSPKRGIGPGTIEKLQTFANEHDWSLLEAAQNVDLSPIGGKQNKTIGDFAQKITALAKQSETSSMNDLMTSLLDDSGYLDDLHKQNNLESETRIENIQELQTVTTQFDQTYEPDETIDQTRLSAFLTDLSLTSDQDDLEENQKEVTLMTLHAAKGLEFPVVFLVGLEEGIFPSSRSMMKEEDMEEERRLAYVGITRAEKRLFVTNAYSRMLYGRVQSNQMSRFVDEIGDENLNLVNANAGAMPFKKKDDGEFPFARRRRESALHSSYKVSTAHAAAGAQGAENVSWTIGDKVDHKKWGQGTVVKVTGNGKNAELDVAFDNEGIKRLLAEFAPIKKVTD